MKTNMFLASALAATLGLAPPGKPEPGRHSDVVAHAVELVAVAETHMQDLDVALTGTDALAHSLKSSVAHLDTLVAAGRLDDAANFGVVTDGLSDGLSSLMIGHAGAMTVLEASMERIAAHGKDAADALAASARGAEELADMPTALAAMADAVVSTEALRTALRAASKAAQDADFAIDAAKAAAASGDRARTASAVRAADAAVASIDAAIEATMAQREATDNAIEAASAAIAAARDALAD